jgi:DNA-binding XRE family transcriptional regulator
MTRRQRCPRCRYTRTWVIRRDKHLGARCRYEWRPGLPLRLTRHQWQTLLRCHIRGLSAAAVAEETGLHRQRVLRALVGANLRRLRGKLGLSQEALADLAGIHRTYVGSVERGERNVSIDNVSRLAWALRVDIRELLTPISSARQPRR